MKLNNERKKSTIDKHEIQKPTQKKVFNLNKYIKYLVSALLLPIVFVAVSIAIGTALLTSSVKQAEVGMFQVAKQLAQLGKHSFSSALLVTENYFPANFLFSNEKGQIIKKIKIGEQVASSEISIFTSLITFSNIYNGNSTNPSADYKSTLANFKNALLGIDELRAQNLLPENLKSKLDENSYLITILGNSIDTTGPIFGFNGKRKYLFLFQNNMEIRPGGGFIGSYGILEIKNGRIEKFEIHDVYEADGKLKTHIEPPYGLRRYGGVSHWFLRDSNFDVDSVINAAASADILQKATGDEIDGVIAVDTNFIKNILFVLGEVEVTDYKEKVTADNFYMLTQKHAEVNFFPGSTQKKDFLTSLLKSIQSSIQEKKGVSYLKLLKATEKSIKEKHLFFVFEDLEIQKVFTINNLSASTWDERGVEHNSILDFFEVIDANIGANKANYYLKRSIKQNVLVDALGRISSTATVSYENTSTNDSVFGGDYKNYVRIILPSGSELKSVSVDNKDIPIIPAIIDSSRYGAKNFIPPKGLEIEKTKAQDKEVIGFFMTVPKSSTKKVTIFYSVPQLINTNSPEFSYSLRVLKQPGTDRDPYSLTFLYPTKFQPVDLDKSIIDLGGKIIYETNLAEDKDIKIKFSQK